MWYRCEACIYILQATVNFVKKKTIWIVEEKKISLFCRCVVWLSHIHETYIQHMHMLQLVKESQKEKEWAWRKQQTIYIHTCYIYIIRCFTVDDPFSHSLITSKNARSKSIDRYTVFGIDFYTSQFPIWRISIAIFYFWKCPIILMMKL